MQVTVGEMMGYLAKQNPKAKVCYFDENLNDYTPLEDYLFKRVVSAKESFKKILEKIFAQIEDENERNDKINSEMSNYFKNVNDDDIVIGLKKSKNVV